MNSTRMGLCGKRYSEGEHRIRSGGAGGSVGIGGPATKSGDAGSATKSTVMQPTPTPSFSNHRGGGGGILPTPTPTSCSNNNNNSNTAGYSYYQDRPPLPQQHQQRQRQSHPTYNNHIPFTTPPNDESFHHSQQQQQQNIGCYPPYNHHFGRFVSYSDELDSHMMGGAGKHNCSNNTTSFDSSRRQPAGLLFMIDAEDHHRNGHSKYHFRKKDSAFDWVSASPPFPHFASAFPNFIRHNLMIQQAATAAAAPFSGGIGVLWTAADGNRPTTGGQNLTKRGIPTSTSSSSHGFGGKGQVIRLVGVEAKPLNLTGPRIPPNRPHHSENNSFGGGTYSHSSSQEPEQKSFAAERRPDHQSDFPPSLHAFNSRKSDVLQTLDDRNVAKLNNLSQSSSDNEAAQGYKLSSFSAAAGTVSIQQPNFQNHQPHTGNKKGIDDHEKTEKLILDNDDNDNDEFNNGDADDPGLEKKNGGSRKRRSTAATAAAAAVSTTEDGTSGVSSSLHDSATTATKTNAATAPAPATAGREQVDVDVVDENWVIEPEKKFDGSAAASEPVDDSNTSALAHEPGIPPWRRVAAVKNDETAPLMNPTAAEDPTDPSADAVVPDKMVVVDNSSSINNQTTNQTTEGNSPAGDGPAGDARKMTSHRHRTV